MLRNDQTVRVIVMIWLRCDERCAMAKRIGKVVLHRENQIAAGEAGREPVREGVQLADLRFATR